MGFLNYMLRHYNPAEDRDIIFIPIALNYDRIIEDQNLITRRDPDSPRPTKTQMLRATFRFYRRRLSGGTKRRQQNFGYAGVNFGRPLSIHEFCEKESIDFQTLSRDERFETTEQLAQHLMDEIQYVIPILPVPLVATIFRNNPDTTFTAFEVKTLTLSLIQKLQSQGAPIRDQEKPKEQTIQRALAQMTRHEILLEQNNHFKVNPLRLDLLDYYANSLSHWQTN
jgi:glycerol-3-phosphate O-acyltransferase